ncbi:mitochondrial holo-[acyl-carrier-protein] synthase [Yamadazyma tenuis]|uniref:mitochondrial holo-[acyl-carrier-protein] synthase n=1 Tax=Candida tenuis TaxID=2315449 RepID=UPI0027A619A7|nr:mitochondrial holo-[acyl-carrier-protein] synthase [Yamadazyma tenuis]
MPVFSQLSISNHSKSMSFLAGSWAIKEAIYKTLDSQDQKSFTFKEWFRIYDERGKPVVCSDTYSKNNEEFLLSISHEDDVLIASVIRQQVSYL